jgi:serine/threonine protein kinase
MNPHLSVETGQRAGTSFEIPPSAGDGELLMGRSRSCHLRLRDGLISRRHCRFQYDGTTLRVKDLESKNGTRVNGRYIKDEVLLEDGDVVQVGGVKLTVQWPETQTEIEEPAQPLEAMEIREGEIEEAEGEAEEKTSEIDPLLGSNLAGYTLKALIYEGRRSRVYRAHRPEMEEDSVAIKLLRMDHKPEQLLQERFLRGGRMASRLRHPNLVRMLRAGRVEGAPYHAMEFIEGEELQSRINSRAKPMETEEAFMIARQALAALQHVYEQGYVMRSVQPDNVLMTEQMQVKLADYDILKRLPGDPQGDITEVPEVSGAKDIRFAAPEMISRPLMADQRADVFGVGAIIYFVLTGKPPFGREQAENYPHRAFSREFAPPRDINPYIPPSLCEVINRALSNYLDKRYQTPEEMLEALEEAI